MKKKLKLKLNYRILVISIIVIVAIIIAYYLIIELRNSIRDYYLKQGGTAMLRLIIAQIEERKIPIPILIDGKKLICDLVR